MGYIGRVYQLVILICVAYLIQKISEYIYGSNLPVVIGGKVHPDFQKVKDLFRKYVSSGRIKGGSFAVFHKGRPIVDLWGGYADEESEIPWKNDTITIIHSATKGVVAILAAVMFENYQDIFKRHLQDIVKMAAMAEILILVCQNSLHSGSKQLDITSNLYMKLVGHNWSSQNKGWLDYEKPVSHYWPNFGINGKENITLKLLLTHEAGLFYVNETLSLRFIKSDPIKLEKFLEEQTPVWPPGDDFAYHAFTFGFFVDKVLQKADPYNRTVDQLFHEEIAKPFGIDLMIGAPRCQNYRIARMSSFTLTDMILGSLFSLSQLQIAYHFLKPNSIIMKSSNNLLEMQKPGVFNDPSLREIPLSSNMGFGNARSLAKLYGILANKGKLGDKTLLSENTIKTLTTVHRSGQSKDMGIGVVIGKGVLLTKNPKGQAVFGHPGYGGQMAFADVHNNVGMAYVTNHLSIYSFGNDPNFIDLQNIFYECFDKFKVKEK